MRSQFVGLMGYLIVAGSALGQDKAAPTDAKKSDVDEKAMRALIEKLGDTAFDVREVAQKRLVDLGEPALELLRKAAKDHADLEVRERLEQVIQAISASFFVELRRFDGPGYWTSRLAMAPDGKHVVVVSGGALRCLNLDDGKEKVTFEFPNRTGNSWGLGLSADGRRVIVGSDDQMARIFDLDTGKLIKELKGHNGPVHGAAFLPDGKRAITGASDRSLRLWDVETGQQLRTFENVPDHVISLAVSPDGKLVAVGLSVIYQEPGAPGTIGLWDVESGRLIRMLTGHTKRLCTMRFSADGKTLLSSSFDKTARLWDVAQGKLLKTFEGHPGKLESAAFSVDEKRVLTVGDNENPIVILWDIVSGGILYQTTPLGSGRGFLDVAVLPDGRHCVTCGKDGSVRVWEWKR